ncbi:MAG: DNA glycosylase AlkZ-like family protein [Pseudonocardiaceae bacterium]
MQRRPPAEHEPHLLAAQPLPLHHVDLLAYEDPSLKGYFATRHRYVDHQHRTTLFNTIGEVRASIAVAGRCVGTWQFDRRTRTIDHNLYAPIPNVARRAITERLDQMTEFMRSEPC